VFFSEAMDPTTITGTVFTLADSTNGGTVAGQVTVSANGFTATLTPSSSLAPLTLYTATISIGARDVSGNRLAANFTWSFTTGTGSATPITGTYDGAEQIENLECPECTVDTRTNRWLLSVGSTFTTFTLREATLVGPCLIVGTSQCTPEFTISGGQSGGSLQEVPNAAGHTVSGSVGSGQLHFVYEYLDGGIGDRFRTTFDGTLVTP
jgi:hypothetical protein